MKSDACLHRWSSHGFRGLVRADWASMFADQDPRDWIRQTSDRVMRQRESVRVDRCRTPGGVVYAKVITAASDTRKKKIGLIPSIKWALRWSRSVTTMRICRRMERAGIDCAPIVLAVRKREGVCKPIDVIISIEVPGPGLMTILRGDGDLRTKRLLVEQAAMAIARLHARGFMHGDLHPNNIVPDVESQKMWFIDNDRTREWYVPLPWAFRTRNLGQMGYRLERDCPELLDDFLRAYFTAAKFSKFRTNAAVRLVTYKVRNRLKKDGRARKNIPMVDCASE